MADGWIIRSELREWIKKKSLSSTLLKRDFVTLNLSFIVQDRDEKANCLPKGIPLKGHSQCSEISNPIQKFGIQTKRTQVVFSERLSLATNWLLYWTQTLLNRVCSERSSLVFAFKTKSGTFNLKVSRYALSLVGFSDTRPSDRIR